jgi:hypothetical protein
LSNEVDWRRKEFTTLLTWTAPSSTPSSASSADALAPVSSKWVSFQTLSPRISGTPLLTNIDSTKGNHGTIDFVDDTIDLLHVVTVGHEFVAGNDILKRAQISVKYALKGILIEDLGNACDKSRWGNLGITECADLVNNHFDCNSRRKI